MFCFARFMSCMKFAKLSSDLLSDIFMQHLQHNSLIHSFRISPFVLVFKFWMLCKHSFRKLSLILTVKICVFHKIIEKERDETVGTCLKLKVNLNALFKKQCYERTRTHRYLITFIITFWLQWIRQRSCWNS